MEPPERDFHHPYQPYDIQSQFMNALYDCIEAGKVGIFESPTGECLSLTSLIPLAHLNIGTVSTFI